MTKNFTISESVSLWGNDLYFWQSIRSVDRIFFLSKDEIAGEYTFPVFKNEAEKIKFLEKDLKRFWNNPRHFVMSDFRQRGIRVLLIGKKSPLIQSLENLTDAVLRLVPLKGFSHQKKSQILFFLLNFLNFTLPEIAHLRARTGLSSVSNTISLKGPKNIFVGDLEIKEMETYEGGLLKAGVEARLNPKYLESFGRDPSKYILEAFANQQDLDITVSQSQNLLLNIPKMARLFDEKA